jgi:hypothetical protein
MHLCTGQEVGISPPVIIPTQRMTVGVGQEGVEWASTGWMSCSSAAFAGGE